MPALTRLPCRRLDVGRARSCGERFAWCCCSALPARPALPTPKPSCLLPLPLLQHLFKDVCFVGEGTPEAKKLKIREINDELDKLVKNAGKAGEGLSVVPYPLGFDRPSP